MAEKTDPVLDIRNLRVEFRNQGEWRPAVKDTSFHLDANETLAVVGESGSGKSVTALSILRLLPQIGARIPNGEILFNGVDLTLLTQSDMAAIRGNSIAMIFQEPMTSLNPTMTVGDQIAEPLMIHRGLDGGAARTETLRLLDRVRIASAKTRFGDYPHQFSGGMRQRIMIAMALACRPKLLIADEPTTALDVTIQAQILELIKELQDEEQMSVLFITHDMGVVAEIADRMIVMRHGEIVEAGTSLDVFGRPRHPYTKMLLHAVPRLGAMTGEDKPRRFPLIDEVGEAVKPVRTEAHPAPLHPSETILKVDGLTTRFDVRGGILRRVTGRVHAVEDVSFTLKAGETLALVGESGCGKSTTGRSILRLIEPASGTVEVAGTDVVSLSPRRLRDMRRKMQMIFQDPFASLDPRQRIGDAIAEPMLLHGLADRKTVKDRIAALLESVGLEPGFAQRYPHEFSGGQRQRICIARALSLEPRLIIADESVSALDVSIKAQIVNLMIDLQERLGLSYLFISHDMAVVERISHRVAVMLRGQIVEIGPRSRIFGNPQHPYTKTLLSAVLVPDPARRHERRKLDIGEIKSVIRPPDYQVPVRGYREVAEGHLVQNWESA